MPTPNKRDAALARSCLVTREAKAKAELIRFVVSPEGKLVADLSGKLPGRGIYVTASKRLVAEAITKRLFSKAAGEPVAIPDGFVDHLQTQLAKKTAESLSLARKAGRVVAGFDAVNDAIRSGQAAALIQSPDASPDQARKLRDDSIPTFRELPASLLSQVMGRENAVYAAVTRGPAADFFIENARRFALFLA